VATSGEAKGIAALKMKASQDPLPGPRMVVLHKIGGQAKSLKLVGPVDLDEEAPLVLEHLGMP
jgi:hypothetical protein